MTDFILNIIRKSIVIGIVEKDALFVLIAFLEIYAKVPLSDKGHTGTYAKYVITKRGIG